MTYHEQMQAIVRKYRNSDEEWPTTSRHIAAWAIGQGLWQPQLTLLISKCAEEVSDAMREEHILDRQGRKVRAKHAVRLKIDGRQTVLWDDIRTAPRSHMAVAFQQRRQQIVGDCRQLKMDVDSFNENLSQGEPIQMCFDFTADLAELEAADVA
ncbi:MAG: hypothetical protein IH957_05250 [Chloroflexi bacterium]|nr:hypothetical protein [Chloroflexota bacterium]